MHPIQRNKPYPGAFSPLAICQLSPFLSKKMGKPNFTSTWNPGCGQEKVFPTFTLPETNSSHLKMGLPKRKVVFQSSIFRCYVSFREGIPLRLLKFPNQRSGDFQDLANTSSRVLFKAFSLTAFFWGGGAHWMAGQKSSLFGSFLEPTILEEAIVLMLWQG